MSGLEWGDVRVQLQNGGLRERGILLRKQIHHALPLCVKSLFSGLSDWRVLIMIVTKVDPNCFNIDPYTAARAGRWRLGAQVQC